MVQIDMNMPKNCSGCPFAEADLIAGVITLRCVLLNGKRMYAPGLIDRKDRPDWCPLIEVKENAAT